MTYNFYFKNSTITVIKTITTIILKKRKYLSSLACKVAEYIILPMLTMGCKQQNKNVPPEPSFPHSTILWSLREAQDLHTICTAIGLFFYFNGQPNSPKKMLYLPKDVLPSLDNKLSN